MTKEEYMQRAIELSLKERGYTAPNPMVGCVVVKEGRIIAEGLHEHYGGFHAERNALLSCNEDMRGAELYVTLEPCCHHGQTPPCTDIIIEKQIGKVYIGAMDCNPLVAGKGVRILREAGITVETGILEERCREVNEVFFHYMEKGLPFVAMKYAMTLDGKIACANGDSKWVTGEESRAYVQQLRKYYTGIMVGINTVLADDPLLTCRTEPSCNPKRIVCDTHLQLPLDCQIVRTAREVFTYVAYCDAEPEKQRALEAAGIKLLCIPDRQGQVDVSLLLKRLAEEQIDSILLEGGGTLNASMLKQGMVNRVYAFIAPKLVGGAKARSPVEGEGVDNMAGAFALKQTVYQQFGEDLLVTGIVK